MFMKEFYLCIIDEHETLVAALSIRKFRVVTVTILDDVRSIYIF